MISPAELRKLLRYEPETGKLFWKVKPAKRIAIGAEAGTKNALGYLIVGVMGERIRAHRIIWAMAHECWPPDAIDHINGDPSDNRLDNLRLATLSENQWNRRRQKNNRAGYKGVNKHKLYNKWSAEIWVYGKKKYLGLFESPELANEAYKAAAEKLHGEFARTD